MNHQILILVPQTTQFIPSSSSQMKIKAPESLVSKWVLQAQHYISPLEYVEYV